MAVEQLTLKTLLNIVGRSIPEIVYLFASFFRRKAGKFRAISEHGNLYRRVGVTAALAAVCGTSSYFVLKLDPSLGLESVTGLSPMDAAERGLWAALIPLIAVPPMYGLFRLHAKQSSLATFFNLALVTSTLLVAIPGTLVNGGAKISALGKDLDALRAGRAEGTAVHQVYCGAVENWAAIEAHMRQTDRMNRRLARNYRTLVAHNRTILRSRAEVEEAKARIQEAGGMVPGNEPLMEDVMDAMDRDLAVAEQTLQLHDRTLRLGSENADQIDRYIELQNRQTMLPFRLLSAYPTATLFLAVGAFLGFLIYAMAGAMAWVWVVKPQITRLRRIMAGTTVVVVLFTLWVGFGLLRSGFLEAMLQEHPTREMISAQLRSRFEAATPLCGALNNHGLW